MKEALQTVYDYSARLLDGRVVCLAEFRGRVLLIVNTASQCGFTPQYGALERLYRNYKERGLEVLGFPCNQFGAQEPGTEEEIGAFCQQNYGVSFPMFSKVDVNGPDVHPLFGFLKHQEPGLLGMERIQWNFTKFLVDRAGRPVKRYAPARRPASMIGDLERLIGVEQVVNHG